MPTSSRGAGSGVVPDGRPHPDAVITQIANAYADGSGPGITPVAQWWADRAAGQPVVDGLLSAEGTRAQWLAGARDPEHIDPGQYAADQAVLGLPGRAQYMTDRCGITSRRSRATSNSTPGCATAAPRCSPSGGAMTRSSSQPVRMRTAATFQNAEVVLLDTGHFALEEEVDTIATNVDAFLVKHHS